MAINLNNHSINKHSVGRFFSRILVSRFTCFELSQFLVFSVLLAISFCTLLCFRTTYNPLSYNVFCSDRFTDNGSRFTSFIWCSCTNRWTKLAIGKRWTMDQASCKTSVGRYFLSFQIAPSTHKQLDKMLPKMESVPEVLVSSLILKFNNFSKKFSH